MGNRQTFPKQGTTNPDEQKEETENSQQTIPSLNSQQPNSSHQNDPDHQVEASGNHQFIPQTFQNLQSSLNPLLPSRTKHGKSCYSHKTQRTSHSLQQHRQLSQYGVQEISQPLDTSNFSQPRKLLKNSPTRYNREIGPHLIDDQEVSKIDWFQDQQVCGAHQILSETHDWQLTELSHHQSFDKDIQSPTTQEAHGSELEFSTAVPSVIPQAVKRPSVFSSFQSKRVCAETTASLSSISGESIDIEQPSTSTYPKPTASNMLESSSFSATCTEKEIWYLSKTILLQEQRLLAKELGLTDQEVEHIEHQQRVHGYSSSEVPYQIMKKWRQMKGIGATRDRLQAVLNNIRIKKEKNPSKTSTINDDLIAEIQKKQQDFFNEIQLPRPLWLHKKYIPLEEVFVELAMRKKDKQGQEVDEMVDIKDIFQKETQESRLRILVEGHPGFGKTCLLYKILSDWSKGEKYVSELFQLAFLIPLRSFCGSLESHLLQQCHKATITTEIIDSLETRVLILLDGLDEATDETRKAILPLLKGLVFPKVTIVLTSRTGFYHLPKDTAVKDVIGIEGGGSFDEIKLWERRIQIKGISEDSRKEFLRKYLQNGTHEIDELIKRLPVIFNDFYQCPLFLLLLGVIIDDEGIDKIETKTELYKAILNSILRRSREKKSQRLQIDVFVPENNEASVYRVAMVEFGCLCLKKLKSQILTFEQSELVVGGVSAYDLGFLTRSISFAKREEQHHYEPLHKSFMEFLAALYLSTIDQVHLDAEIEDLMREGVRPTEHQLLYHFLGGLLGFETTKLFNSLVVFKDFIGLFHMKYKTNTGDYYFIPYALEPVLKETNQPTEAAFNSLMHFASIYLNRVCYVPSFEFLGNCVGPLVRLSSQSSFIKELTLKLAHLPGLYFLNWVPKPFKINKITLEIDKILNLSEMYGNVQCRKLIIEDDKLKNPLLLKVYPGYLLHILHRFHCEKLFLKFSFQKFPKIQNSKFQDSEKAFCKVSRKLTSERFTNVNVHHLSLSCVRGFHLLSNPLVDLIKTKKITFGIKVSMGYLKLSAKEEFRDFFHVIAQSHLASFAFDSSLCSGCSIEFPSVFFKSHKSWKYLELRGEFITHEEEKCFNDIELTSIDHFNCIDFQCNDKTFLSQILPKCQNLKRLTCTNIHQIQLETLNAWEGIDTIETLELEKQPIDAHFTGMLSLFKNLTKLKINWIPCNIHNNQSVKTVVDFLLQLTSASTLPHLSTLHIDSYKEILVEYLRRLFLLEEESESEYPVGAHLLQNIFLRSVRINPPPLGKQLITEYENMIMERGRSSGGFMDAVCRCLSPENLVPLARNLGLETADVEEVMTRCEDDRQVARSIVARWQHKNGEDAKCVSLRNALNSIYREDVANEFRFQNDDNPFRVVFRLE